MFWKIIGELKTFLDPAALSVLDWKPLVPAAPMFVAGSFKYCHLAPGGQGKIVWGGETKGSDSSEVWRQAPVQVRQRWAQDLVALYFREVLGSPQIAVDLGPESFRAIGEKLVWQPRDWGWEIAPRFREGLTKLYDGYYGGNIVLATDGVTQLGLVPKGGSPQEVLDLFFKHFSSANSGPVLLTKAHFFESFKGLFIYLKNSKVVLAADFAFLGFMLFRFYQTMELLGSPADIAQIFQQSRARV